MILSEKQVKAKNKRSNVGTLTLIAAFTIIILIIIWRLLDGFSVSSSKNIESAMAVMQAESTAQTIKALNIKLKDAERFTNSIAEIVGSHNDIQGASAVAMLQKLSAGSDFRKMGIANVQGRAITTDNTDGEFNVSEREYFFRAMEGECGSSQAIESKVDGEAILNIFAPIMRDGEFIGLVFGSYTTKQLTEFLNLQCFGGAGYSYIFAKNGQIIWVPEENDLAKDQPMDIWMQFEKCIFMGDEGYGDFYGNVLDDQTGVVQYSLSGIERTAYYTPVGTNDWYILTILPTSYIESYAKPLYGNAVKLIVEVILITVALILLILWCVLRGRRALGKVNREIELVTNSIPGGVLQFAVDENIGLTYVNDGFLEMSGYSIEEIKQYFDDSLLNMIHPEDQVSLKEILAEQRHFEMELRMKCKGEKYKWVLLKAIISENSSEYSHCQGVCVDIHRRHVEHMEIKEKAQKDLMTGLYNRVETENMTKHFIEENGLDRNAYTGFCIIDLDHFKNINDSWGHAIGDQALKKVAAALIANTRTSDIVGRLGGDEFFVLLKNMTSIERVEEKVAAICKSIQNLNVDADIAITASIGVAMAPQDGEKFQILYMEADSALYKAKKKGKNCYAFYGEDK